MVYISKSIDLRVCNCIVFEIENTLKLSEIFRIFWDIPTCIAKSENALIFSELARVFEITSLTKLQNCKNIEIFYRI